MKVYKDFIKHAMKYIAGCRNNIFSIYLYSSERTSMDLYILGYKVIQNSNRFVRMSLTSQFKSVGHEFY